MEEISLEDFLAHWPEVSREDLCIICECSMSVVNHWFTKGASYKEPGENHRRRLADAHRAFVSMQMEPTRFREIFNKYYK